MSLAINRSTVSSLSGFTAVEVAGLVAWGDRHRLEVVMKPAGADFGGRIAVVGYGEGTPSWAIYRAAGDIWVDFIPDPSGQGFERYTVEVASLEDAMARIIAETEA
jgi:hypothetical protein